MINSLDELAKEISMLQQERTLKAVALKQQMSVVYESVKPINLIKSTVKQITNSSEIKKGFLNVALGMGTGYLAKLVFQTMAKSPLAKVAGTLLQFGVSNAAMNNPEIMNAVEEQIFQFFVKKDTKKNHQQPASNDLN